MSIHVAVPLCYSTPDRERLHRWTLAEWGRYHDRLGWTLVYATDEAREQEDEPPRTTDRFNHAKAINNAVRAFGGFEGRGDDVLVIADADTFPSPGSLLPRILAAREGRWSCPDRYVNLSEKTTEKVLAVEGFEEGIAVAETATDHVWEGPNSWAGIVVIRRNEFEKVRGYDERFGGWSADDIAFAMSVETLVGPVERIGTVYHLWHPARREETYDRPGFAKSWELTSRYMAAHGDEAATVALIEERP